jgi:hypothetical protein
MEPHTDIARLRILASLGLRIRIPHSWLQRSCSPIFCFWFPDLHPFLTSGIPHYLTFLAAGIQIVTILSFRCTDPDQDSHIWVSGAGSSHFWILGFGFLYNLCFTVYTLDPDPPVIGFRDQDPHILGFRDLYPHNIDFWNPHILGFWDPDPYILGFWDRIFTFWISGIWTSTCCASEIWIPTLQTSRMRVILTALDPGIWIRGEQIMIRKVLFH